MKTAGKKSGDFSFFCVQALLEPAVQPGTPKAGAPGEILKQKLGFSKQKITSPGSYSPSIDPKYVGAAPKPNGAVEGESGFAVHELQAVKCNISKTPPL